MGSHATHVRLAQRRIRARDDACEAGAHALFYDGTCGLCRRAVRLIQRRAHDQLIRFIDVNDDEAMADFPQVDRLRALKRVVLLKPDGRQPGGYDAVTGVMKLLPRWRRLHLLARLWPVQILGHAGYHIVGQNRHRISRLMGWEYRQECGEVLRAAVWARVAPRLTFPSNGKDLMMMQQSQQRALMAQGQRTAQDPGRAAFLREFLKAPVELGTCFTSSGPLARGIVRDLGLERAGAVIEFGPGPGPVTCEIMKRIPERCRFFAVELNGGLAQEFRRRFPDVTIFQDDASNVRSLCEQAGVVPGEVDVIISTLPFLLFPPDVQQKILHEAAGVLKPGGRFTTITYRMAALMPSVKKFKALMAHEFSTVEFARMVVANIPPAYVYRCIR